MASAALIAAVVLAAGAGTRFGGPKQLADLDGVPLFEHALRAVEAVPAIERIVVVLGARADEIRGGIDFDCAEVVVCDGWEEGQAASLRCGIDAIDGANAALLMLGDMPRITPQVIAWFADLGREHGSEARARAVYDGGPGHPVVLGSAYFAALSGLTGDLVPARSSRRSGCTRSSAATSARPRTSTPRGARAAAPARLVRPRS